MIKSESLSECVYVFSRSVCPCSCMIIIESLSECVCVLKINLPLFMYDQNLPFLSVFR